MWTGGLVAGIAIGDVDIAMLARSLGAHGVTVARAEELGNAFTEALQRQGVSVIDIQVDPDLATPTKRLSGMRRPSEVEGHPVD